MEEKAQVRVTQEDGHVTVEGGGFLDFTNAGEFEQALADAAANADAVTVSFEDAIFIDTAILEYVASASKRLTDRGKRLRVIAVERSQPLRAIQIVGLPDLLDLVIEPAPRL